MKPGPLSACLLPAAAVAVTGCFGGSGGGCMRPTDRDLLAAARAHVGDITLQDTRNEGDADRLTVDACQTSDGEGTATVTVFGRRDDSVRDVRSELTLRREGGRWRITDSSETRRCQQGRGSQEFTSERCT